MKFYKYLFLAFLFFSFSSCKEDKDILPLEPLEGTWEYAFYNPDQQFFFIYQYVFDPNGTFEKNILIRESETPTVLGYYSHSTGNYELRGEAFTEEIERQYLLALDAYLFYVPKDKLKEIEIENVSSSTAKLTFSQNNRSFDLLFPCNDTPNGRVLNCVGALTYRRVD
ncbi:hypothetical protein [Algoriphagus sp.]|uniref:hypothetical protein n=1 Tax=Algoriphagus sp. TaxID=1872435 RepID=UPI0025D10A42|nr:hypothetical protein [Algoriphagus sp.]